MSDHLEQIEHTVAEVHQPDSGPVAAKNPLLRLEPGLAIWTWLVFFAFVFVLWKFAWKPLANIMEERKNSIKDTLDEADAARKSLEQASETQRELIEEGRQRVVEIQQRADESSRKVADEIRSKAQFESEKLIESAKIQIDLEKEKALSELKSEVVQIAVAVATKLIKDNLDEDRNQKLVKEYIEEISK